MEGKVKINKKGMNEKWIRVIKDKKTENKTMKKSREKERKITEDNKWMKKERDKKEMN